ncbi:hypothetical protein B0H17DRAFT_256865 [Mycena rosella]|uniref:Protein kinase domain-containing protein n=1 Tax=Mycena rosella TaxID=1033263 RepID=A0AAD7CWU0_MYCRO|nr:hypothetical protein B0H17DRAFT_256865 [Mycena rosella]
MRAAPTIPSDFRIVPMGDIDLGREIKIRDVRVRPNQGCVRRMYTAKMHGRKSDMTVTIYQRRNSVEEWRDDISEISQYRHPNLVQIFGAASSNGIHATILCDELIPLAYFMDLYRHSHFAAVCIWAYYTADVADLWDYFDLLSQKPLVPCCAFLIRRSTRRLCAQLDAGPTGFTFCAMEIPRISVPGDLTTFNGPNPETAIMCSLTLQQYHKSVPGI